ncbi:toxin-antitoxin system HicB family antitoxin [Microbacterium oxydans]|uniref:Toxin-antitoxin system HicB family antitoxin n=1 Tax=Streptomyces eurythermus TaxID=42237 RepID=A0ABW6Z9V7_9ACTN
MKLLGKAVFSLRLTEDLHEWLKKEAEKRGMSVNALISYILSEYKDDKEF